MSENVKKAEQIKLKVSIQQIEQGKLGSPVEKEMFLNRKILEYLMQLGFDNSHVYNLIVTLLTKGKLRIEFRNYVERLELVEGEEKLTRPQAVSLVEEFIAQNRGQDMDFETTQRIVIQPPNKNS